MDQILFPMASNLNYEQKKNSWAWAQYELNKEKEIKYK